MIYFYHILSFLFLPVYFVLLIFRTFQGKEDIKHLGERFAISKISPKKNDLLIWLHAASIGESNIALTLIDAINSLWLKTGSAKTTLKFLITTGTTSSTALLQKKLSPNVIHQFIPIDNIIFVKKFFRHWQPKLGIFIESELWPALIDQGGKYCKLLLVNARLSDKSFQSWKKLSYVFRAVVYNFSQIIVQSDKDFNKFTQLGITNNIINLGNIKFANKPLTVNKLELNTLKTHFNNKKIIVFASTHIEDEQVLFNIIKPIKLQYPDCYFIVIPRHPERKDDIALKCQKLGIAYSLKSKQNMPLITDDLYIVDTFGELGLFFSLAYLTFIGGSFNQGGHNILEPAYFSNYIIFGPDMSNFADMASNMIHNNAAIQIQDEKELLNKIMDLLSTEGVKEVKTYQANALSFVTKNQQILHNYLAIIEQYLPGKILK